MPDRKFIITLAKLLIAAAWVDGELKNEEINALKDLLFSLEDITGEEWAHLEIFMDSPVNAEERDKLLEEVLDQIRSEEDKKLVMGTLESLFQADGIISDEERQSIKQVLSTEWGMSEQEAKVVAEISCNRTLKGLDYFHLTKEFFDCTGIHERRKFLKCLFQIANASNKTSYDETEEIRRIAKSLKLSHNDFIEAKLTIPDEEREVL